MRCGWRVIRYAYQHSDALFAPDGRGLTKSDNTEGRLVAAAGDGACVRRPRSR
jgi:hypothetical protein